MAGPYPHSSPLSAAKQPQPTTAPTYVQRTSSDSSSSSSSSASSQPSTSPAAEVVDTAHVAFAPASPRIEVLHCFRCTKCVDAVVSSSGAAGDVAADDLAASGMVRFGHNLYYCERCAKMVGYT